MKTSKYGADRAPALNHARHQHIGTYSAMLGHPCQCYFLLLVTCNLRARARTGVCVCMHAHVCLCVCTYMLCCVFVYIYIYMCVCLSYNAFDKWPQSSLLSCTGRLKFKICELRITRYPNLEFFKLSTIIMQSTWAFRLPSLLNMGKQAYSERFKCVCVCVPLDDFWTNQQL